MHLICPLYSLRQVMNSIVLHATETGHIRKNFRGLGPVLLLLVYVIGTIGIDVFHHSFHDHSVTGVHSADHEKDPCHRLLAHGDAKNGCRHKAHITRVDKCKYSHVVFQAPHLLGDDGSSLIAFESILPLFKYPSVFSDAAMPSPQLRGPPAVA